MDRRCLVIFLLLLILFPFSSAQAHEAADIYIERIWATSCEQSNIVTVFMTVDNTAVAHPIGLVRASSRDAEHAHLVEGENACTADMINQIIIPFGEQLDFQQSDYAVAVEMGDDYEAGEPFSLTLTFDMLDENLNSDGIQVDVVIGVPILQEAPAPSDVLVTTPWVRPTIINMNEHDDENAEHSEDVTMDLTMFPAAVYLRLLNSGDQEDRLIDVSTPVAEVTELHQTTMENDMMRMGAIEGLDLPVGEWIAFEPSSYHIMLINLQQELYEGDAIPLTLTFESGTVLSVIVPVYDPMMGDMDAEHDHHDHSG